MLQNVVPVLCTNLEGDLSKVRWAFCSQVSLHFTLKCQDVLIKICICDDHINIASTYISTEMWIRHKLVSVRSKIYLHMILPVMCFNQLFYLVFILIVLILFLHSVSLQDCNCFGDCHSSCFVSCLGCCYPGFNSKLEYGWYGCGSPWPIALK